MHYKTPAFIAACIAFLFLHSSFTSNFPCEVSSRESVPVQALKLFDSLKAGELKTYRFAHFISDTFAINDTFRINPLPIDAESKQDYFPRYMQFVGNYSLFLDYILVFDPALDSVITCDKKVRLYYSDRCDFCDSGFWSGTGNFPTQFHYYRFQEIYASFFSYHDINEVQVFVGGQNRTYLPYASDFPVYAPGKSMKKKWFIKDKNYGDFFLADFPESTNSDFIIDGNGDYTWTESAADRFTAPKSPVQKSSRHK